MQWDYVYADLKLQVTFDAEADSAFGQLTNIEIKALQQLVYHGLMIFSNVRMLYAADDIDKRMVKAVEKALDKPEQDGG